MLKKVFTRVFLSLVAFISILLVTSLEKEDVVKESFFNYDTAIVYLMDSNHMLGKVDVIKESDNVIDLTYELLDILIKDGNKESVIPSGFISILPSETKVNGVSYLDGILQVDLSGDFFDMDASLEEIALESVIYTLTSIDDVSGLILSVDGVQLERLSNITLPNLLTKEFGINKRYDLTSLNDIKSVNEYFISKNGYYIPVTKYVNDDREKIEIIIEDLTSSNTYMTDLISYINSNTKLKEVNIEDNKMKLTFNTYILNDFDTILEEVVDTISYSVYDNYDVDEVIFYVDDKEICKSVLKSIE